MSLVHASHSSSAGRDVDAARLRTGAVTHRGRQEQMGSRAQLQTKTMRVEAATDPPALDGPFGMAKHDRELHTAWSKLNDTVLALDRELNLEPSPR